MATDKFKLVLIGNTDVGKSSLLSRFTNDTFTEVASPTVGVDFISHRIENDGKITRLQIWDTSGQERFRSLIASYLRDASGVIIVFDVTNADSFRNVKTWSQEIDYYVPTEMNKMLVGNKCDLTAERVIDYAQAKDLADSLSIQYVETSAKNSSNVQQAFMTIINHMMSITSAIPAETSNINSESNMKPLENITVTNSEYDLVFKLVLLGDSGVGKSSLLRRFIHDAFDDTFSPTIGIDFISHVIKHNGAATRFQIWDTAGQERFRSLISNYCRNAKGAIVVFDVTNAESFENVTKWLQEIDEDRKNDVKTLLVGNKCDLTTKRVVDHAQAKNLADSLSIPYVEASAKNTTNVELTFMSLISGIMSSESSVIIDNTNIKVGSPEKSKKTTSGFC